jgi:hypothetical protein
MARIEELNCARPLGVPGCYITCRGCLSRYITALVPLLHVLTTSSCSRTADIRAPCGQRQLGAYIWLEGHFRDPRDKLAGATGRTEPHYYAEPGAALACWPCGTPGGPVGDPTAAGRRGMTGHSSS